MCAVDSEIHHAHVTFQIMLYININVWVLMLIFFTNTEASKSERKITPADPPSLPPSIPTTVSAEAEQDVSVESQIKEEVEDWPIREMIAILGHLKSNFCRKLKTFLKGGVLGFWGGVGLMGTIFLLVLVTQRCCSRRGAREKKEVS